jgi:preprotein translocase subunit SecD
MQKNLLIKTLVIIGVLIVFLIGIFGIPNTFNREGLKEAALNRIHLGLDLKGGIHLILQVMVNDAVGAESDHAVEVLKEELQKKHIVIADASKDPDHPEKILIQGVPPDAGGDLRSLVNDRLPEYDIVGGPNNTWILTMKPSALNDLRTRTVDQSIEAIRTRVDSLGVSEPVIQKNSMGNDYQILVQLPGVNDEGRVKDIIQSTARLELRQGFGSQGGYQDEKEALQANLGQLPPNTVMMRGITGGGDRQERVFIVGRVPVVGGTDIRTAEPSTGSDGRPNVTFHLTTAAGNKFRAFTAAHNETGPDPNHYLAVVLDNKVKEFASIRTEIGDTGEIEGGFTDQTAKDLAMLLRSGALPASLQFLNEQTVGPSLGADSIKSGVRAAIWGMVAVLIFMLIYYRGAGVNANIALILNLIILLGCMGWMNVLGLGATLTLPGIAGVILTVGMGVDSNVLIFERIREELRNGKAPAAAVDQGFDRAWTTIIDTHVTTIVSALILFFVGSGPVSGFGLTLILGLLANLFTAVFVSRVIFDAVLSRKQRGAALSI